MAWLPDVLRPSSKLHTSKVEYLLDGQRANMLKTLRKFLSVRVTIRQCVSACLQTKARAGELCGTLTDTRVIINLREKDQNLYWVLITIPWA